MIPPSFFSIERPTQDTADPFLQVSGRQMAWQALAPPSSGNRQTPSLKLHASKEKEAIRASSEGEGERGRRREMAEAMTERYVPGHSHEKEKSDKEKFGRLVLEFLK